MSRWYQGAAPLNPSPTPRQPLGDRLRQRPRVLRRGIASACRRTRRWPTTRNSSRKRPDRAAKTPAGWRSQNRTRRDVDGLRIVRLHDDAPSNPDLVEEAVDAQAHVASLVEENGASATLPAASARPCRLHFRSGTDEAPATLPRTRQNGEPILHDGHGDQTEVEAAGKERRRSPRWLRRSPDLGLRKPAPQQAQRLAET